MNFKSITDLVDGSTMAGSLLAKQVDNYTKTNLQTSGQAQVHFSNLTGKPTTVSGYGIADAITTAGGQSIGGNLTINGTATIGGGNNLTLKATTGTGMSADTGDIVFFDSADTEVGRIYKPTGVNDFVVRFSASDPSKTLYHTGNFDPSTKSNTSHNHTLDSLSNVTITGASTGQVVRWNGTAWVNQTLASADIPDGTTSAKGVVQLIDSTASTSTTLAATANSVKLAYDKANAALPLAGGTMTAGLMFNATATGGPTAATPTALSYGKLQSYGTLNILADTDNSLSEYILLAAGFGLTPTTAQGLKVGNTSFTWQDNTIWHAGNFTPSSKLDISANAVSASKLATARTISLDGDVTGSASFDGSTNITITSTVADDSHAHTGLQSRGSVTALTGTNSPAVGGLSMTQSYNNGYPAAYGNLLSLAGLGQAELLLGWSGGSATDGVTQGVSENNYIRSKRDSSGSTWSAWAKIWTDQNFNPSNKLDVNANAVSASKWVTARTITVGGNATGSIAIDGSADVTLPVNIAAVTTGANGLMIAADKSKLDGIAFSANNYTLPQATTSVLGGVMLYTGTDSASTTLAATASAVKAAYDLASGKLSSTGTASASDKLSVARTISLGGDVTGSASFDGSANITITSTVADDSHNHTSANISDATNANTANMIVKRDASGNFSAGTVTASLSGNASSATKLATARNVNGVAFDGTSDVVIPRIYDSSYTSIINPSGATYTTSTSSITGAIAITLPVGMTSTMLRMTIKVYEYTTNESFEIHCGGYTYSGGNTWANNPFAYIVGNPSIDRRFNVRFGYTAGAKAVIYIGDVGSTWSYPQVVVTDVQCGYGGQSISFTSGWSIGFATAFENVTATISNCQVGYAVSTNTANSNVLRDGSGNFSAGTITAALAGNASTATTLASARTISLSGDVTGSVSFNGSADVVISATVGDDSHNHSISTVTNLQSSLDAKLSLSGGTMTGKITTPNAAMGIRLGDDAEIGDGNVANQMVIQGVQDPTTGGITFGSGKDTNIYRGAANQLNTDDSLVVGANLTVNGGYIYGPYGTIARSTDEWLRLNDDSSHTSGVYFGTSITRTDGELQVGSGGSAFRATSAGAVTASTSVTAPTFIGNLNGYKNIDSGNEMTLANGFAGGTLYLNYRGASSDITEVRVSNGMINGGLTQVTASKVNVNDKVKMEWNSTENSLDFVFI